MKKIVSTILIVAAACQLGAASARPATTDRSTRDHTTHNAGTWVSYFSTLQICQTQRFASVYIHRLSGRDDNWYVSECQQDASGLYWFAVERG